MTNEISITGSITIVITILRGDFTAKKFIGDTITTGITTKWDGRMDGRRHGRRNR